MKIEEAQKHLTDYLNANRGDVFGARLQWASEFPQFSEEDMHLSIEYTDCWTECNGATAWECFPVDHAKGFRVKVVDQKKWEEHIIAPVPDAKTSQYYMECPNCGYPVLSSECLDNYCNKCGKYPYTDTKGYYGAAYDKPLGELQIQE